MSREWKPGDVAMVTSTGLDAAVAVRNHRNDGWQHGASFGGGSAYDDIGHTSARPLVVIDPEDREQARRIAQNMDDQFAANGLRNHGTPDEEIVDFVQAALRSLIAPQKPAEPTGLGAVVEDGGRKFSRASLYLSKPWRDATGGGVAAPEWKGWDDFTAAVKVLSEGVTA